MNEDEFYDMYLDAIKKARPVDALVFPVFNYSGKHTGYRIDCPMCGRSIYGVTTRTNYCSFCGQKLRKVGEME